MEAVLLAFRRERDRRWASLTVFVALAGLAVWLGLGGRCAPLGPGAGAGVVLERVLAEEPLTRPVHLAHVPDGSGDLVVVEQAGVIKRFAPGAARAQGVFLDIRGRVSRDGNEEGLLSIAFHPDYAANRRFYVYYSAAAPRRSVLARYTAPVDAGPVDPGTESIVMQVAQPYSNHNGGHLLFGPDGMLYVALGDGGAGGDPHGHGQNLRTLLGSILRIDVDRAAGGRAYAVPADNPFTSAQGRPEIWAYGLRNPWRMGFDRRTGVLYAADVGQNAVEEVNRIERGANYGWNEMEGSRCYAAFRCDKAGLALPIAEYDHDQGRSITGGTVYRGRALPALQGRYVFADFLSGTVWTIPADARALTTPEPLLQSGLYIASFGEDAAGELYAVDHRGGIYRFAPGR